RRRGSVPTVAPTTKASSLRAGAVPARWTRRSTPRVRPICGRPVEPALEPAVAGDRYGADRRHGGTGVLRPHRSCPLPIGALAPPQPGFGRPHGGLVWFLVPDIRKIEGAGDGRD